MPERAGDTRQKRARHPSASGIRRTGVRSHPREGGVQGLVERTRLGADLSGLPFLPDPLMRALPSMRSALLNGALDGAVRTVLTELTRALAPAAAQMWIADPSSWLRESARMGGHELFPSLRLRGVAVSGIAEGQATRDEHDEHDEHGTSSPPPSNGARSSAVPDALVEAVVSTRQSLVLFNVADHPAAPAWLDLLRSDQESESRASASAGSMSILTLGTLAAFPLRARGQFFGVLALAAASRLNTRHVAAIEELADVAAIAADRDRLLRYSRSQEALAQTVVSHAPVAMAVLTGAEHIFALTNPAFVDLLGLDAGTELVGKRLEDVVPDRARTLAASFRLDAVHQFGEPQSMLELPIHLERGMTYWNVRTSPLAGISTSVGGVLIAAAEVTRQVFARQRAVESADIAQERISQMMTLHATSLAVASQLGADPRELLADILHRSIQLLGARAGAIYVRDPRHDTLEVVVGEGLRGDYSGSRIRTGEGLAGQVAATGKGLIVDDYRMYPFRAAIYADEAFTAVLSVPLIHHGQVVGVLDVLDDTERRAFTDDDLWLIELFASQAAQAIENARIFVELEHAYRKQRELDRMKDDFIATASHELRTPLTGVQGFLDLLIDYPGSRDDDRALEFLRKASESAEELAGIAERLLETSRIDTGRMELHMNAVRLAPVVEDVLSSFRELQLAHGTTHELIAEVPADLYVDADLGRLKEVLENLVGNAIKYSPYGGSVCVSCAPADFDVPRPHNSLAAEQATAPFPVLTSDPGGISESPTMVLEPLALGGQAILSDIAPPENAERPVQSVVDTARARPYFIVTVSDHGMGIPHEERDRLFGRFARLDSARISEIRGTGLGLYICRQIMRAMGGDVWLQESTPGVGSTFAFAIPASTRVSVERAEAVRVSAAGAVDER